MDATAGITAAQKALDTLKTIPAWLLLGLAISLLSIWLWPPLSEALPASVKSIVPIVVFFAVVLAGSRLTASGLAYFLEKRRRLLARDRERLLKLYRPLAALFLTRHVTVSSSVIFPHFRHRVKNARAELSAYRRRSVGIRRAWRALFERRMSSSAEVKFGGDFPLPKIIEIVKKEKSHGDEELFRLVRQADRSLYEEPNRGLLTDEELALFKHIDVMHRRLSARSARAV